MKPFLSTPRGASLLGLAFDGSRVEGCVVRRTNGSAEIRQTLLASLSLNLLTDDPELVGRELRKHLDAAGIRERNCAVAVPLTWALTLPIRLPDLPEADLESFLQIEIERGFPYPPDAIRVSRSPFRTSGGQAHVLVVGIPADHLARLEAVLHSAQLRPTGISLGISSLPGSEAESSSEAVLSVLPATHGLGLQVSCDHGVAALRSIEGVFERDNGAAQLRADQVRREFRVSLGQLPGEVRQGLRSIRVYGDGPVADDLMRALEPFAAALALPLDRVRTFPPGSLPLTVTTTSPVTAAASLALRYLGGQRPAIEYLQPRASRWQAMTTRYGSSRFAGVGGVAAVLMAGVLLAFLYQQWQLTRWGSRWRAIKDRAVAVEAMQRQVRQFRPWYDDSSRSLTILRRLTEAFPEDGSVSAKNVEIREPSLVTCSGSARDHQALLKVLDQLRGSQQVASVQIEQIRGRAPSQFTFNFLWQDSTAR